MDIERYKKRSNLIQDMKQFCKDNKISNYSVFVDYCRSNNEEWFEELITGTQVCKYMAKFLN